jgi:hypothetical protein
LEAPVEDLRWGERVPALILFVALIALGAWPRSISDSVNASLQSSYPATPESVIVSDPAEPAAHALARSE